MSEVNYAAYLQDINKRLEATGRSLKLDFEVDSNHLMEQVNILEQYLYFNNILIQINSEYGDRELLGFIEMPEQLWHKERIEAEKEETRKIKERNLLYIRNGEVSDDIQLELFNTDDINVIDDDIESEEEAELESNEELETDIDNDVEDEPDEFNEHEEEKTGYEVEDFDSYEEHISENSFYLNDVFDDIQKAQQMMLEEDDEDDEPYYDEYTLLDDDDDEEEREPDEDEPDDEPLNNSDIDEDDFKPLNGSSDTEQDLDFGNDFGSDFGNASDFEFDGTPMNSMNQGQNQMGMQGGCVNNGQPTMQREITFSDKTVDKANELINKGINSIFKRFSR